ncbi:transcriptional regulator [Xanthomonas arboricola pv. pruni MAFF 301420]|uniref:Transcriptional regulator n=1 Tax=Xanthomonas arboricola pv. pruni MAFF 301420 TaxID=1418095 RepID=W4SJL6_9XANT|nr:transcriptional regulator [Xanthomonas arboricola pv. pruni MAFF 301420]
MLVEPERLALIDDGQTIALEPRMMEVLIALAERAGEVVSAEQLLIEVWHGSFYGDNPVHKTIAQLRRKLGDDSRQPRYIETIRKRGYRLLPKVVFPDDYRGAVMGTQVWGHGSPYVGLQAFDPAHAEVFFGRSHAIAQVLGAMRAQLHSQRGLVLVSGASGCGKTSLLRAGVVPLLAQPGGLDSWKPLRWRIATWRNAVAAMCSTRWRARSATGQPAGGRCFRRRRWPRCPSGCSALPRCMRPLARRCVNAHQRATAHRPSAICCW